MLKVFPKDVAKTVNEKSSVDVKTKLTLFIVLSVIINVIFNTYLLQFLKGTIFYHPVIVTILQIASYSVISISLFKKIALREDEKYEEYQNTKNGNINRFYQLREKEEYSQYIGVNIFEYVNGSYVTAISITYGIFSEERENRTYKILYGFLNSLNRRGIYYQILNIPEKYRNTEEYSRLKNGVNNADNKELSEMFLNLLEVYSDASERVAGLTQTVILLKTEESYQIRDLEQAINTLLGVDTHNSTIKSLKFLDNQELKTVLKDYNCVDAFDLSNLRATIINPKLLAKYNKQIRIHKKINLRTEAIEL